MGAIPAPCPQVAEDEFLPQHIDLSFLFFASIFRYGQRICEWLCSSKRHRCHNPQSPQRRFRLHARKLLRMSFYRNIDLSKKKKRKREWLCKPRPLVLTATEIRLLLWIFASFSLRVFSAMAKEFVNGFVHQNGIAVITHNPPKGSFFFLSLQLAKDSRNPNSRSVPCMSIKADLKWPKEAWILGQDVSAGFTPSMYIILFPHFWLPMCALLHTTASHPLPIAAICNFSNCITRSKRSLEIQQLRERKKEYDLKTTISLVKETAKTKFVETIATHFRLNIDPKYNNQQLRATVRTTTGFEEIISTGISGASYYTGTFNTVNRSLDGRYVVVMAFAFASICLPFWLPRNRAVARRIQNMRWRADGGNDPGRKFLLDGEVTIDTMADDVEFTKHGSDRTEFLKLSNE
ncbi:50S ribosomal protein L1, chloroplastic [Glycine soja]